MALVKAGPPRLDSDRDRRSSRRYWVWPSWPTYTGLTYRSSYTIAGSSGPMDERQSSQVASHTPHATTATRISMRCRANEPSQQQDGRLCYRILSSQGCRSSRLPEASTKPSHGVQRNAGRGRHPHNRSHIDQWNSIKLGKHISKNTYTIFPLTTWIRLGTLDWID